MPAKPDGVMFSLAEIKRAYNMVPLDGGPPSAVCLLIVLEGIAVAKIQKGESRGIPEKFDFIKLSEVGKFVAEIEGGKPTTDSTIYKWINHGKQTSNGPWIKLKWRWKDGRRGCTKFQVRKFLERTRKRW